MYFRYRYENVCNTIFYWCSIFQKLKILPHVGYPERRARIKKKEGKKRAEKNSPQNKKRKKRAFSKEKKEGGKSARAKYGNIS